MSRSSELGFVLKDLKTRQISAEDRRIPGGVIGKSREVQGAWWNGFYWGLQVAIERLESIKRGGVG